MRGLAIPVSAGLVAAAAGYAAVRSGGSDPFDLNVALLLLGLAGALYGVAERPAGAATRWDRLALAAVPLFPAYVALQLLPLPLPLVRFANPARAAVADSLGLVTTGPVAAPITILPAATWTHLSRVVGYALVFLLVRHAVRRSESRPWLVAAPLLLLGALEAAIGLGQHAADARMVLGTYLNQNHFAGLLEMVLPLAVMFAAGAIWQGRLRGSMSAAQMVRAALGTVAAIALMAAITTSLSRAGFLSMLGSLLVMAVVGLGPLARGRSRGLLAAGLLLAGVSAVVLLPTPALISSFGEISADPNEDGRWLITRDTLRMVGDYPLFGTGLGTYYPGLLPYQTASLNLTWMFAHNDYLQLLAELGVLGFLVPAALVLVSVGCAAKAALSGRDIEVRCLGLGCLGSLSAILFHSVADFNLYIPANAMAMAYVAGLAVGIHGCQAAREERTQTGRAQTATVAIPRALRPAVVVSALWLCLYATGWVVLASAAEPSPGMRAALCRVGICNTFAAAADLKARHDGDAAAVPPEALIGTLAQDPAGAYHWLDVAESLASRGRVDEARSAVSRALELGPNIPFFQMRAAHFHFLHGDTRQGLELMARSIAGNPVFEAAAFDTYTNLEIGLDDILESGLASRDSARSYFRRLLAQNDLASAGTMWEWLVVKGWSDVAMASEYVNWLAGAQQYEEASHVWSRYRAVAWEDAPALEHVFNGDFEREPTGSVFDWRIRQRPGLTVSFDPGTAFSGRRAARLEFDGTENVHQIDLWQSVVLPAGRYRLDARVRTEGVTTREGVSLTISGAGVAASTEPVLGTTGWVEVGTEFEVPPGAELLRLGPSRTRSFRFDSHIRGTVWIDDVRIVRLDGGEEGGRSGSALKLAQAR